MGCACKNNKILKRDTDLIYSNKSNGKRITNKIFNFFISFLNKIIVLLLIVIVIPYFIISMIISMIMHGRFIIYLPKFMRFAMLEKVKEMQNNKKDNGVTKQ